MFISALGNTFTKLTTRSEFKEAFPAGRFRPICKIQAKRGASVAAVAEQIKHPEWWNSTRIIQAFDSVLQDKVCVISVFLLTLTNLKPLELVQETFLPEPN